MLSQGKAIEGTDPIDTDLLSEYVKTHTPVTVTPGRLVLKNRKERARPERWPWTYPGPQGSGRFLSRAHFAGLGASPWVAWAKSASIHIVQGSNRRALPSKKRRRKLAN